MLSYVIRRLLLFIPTILVISLIAFGLSNMVSGDPVGLIMGEEAFSSDDKPSEYSSWLEEYRRTASQYHLDIPKFYFSILPSNYPDTLYKVLPFAQRKYVKSLLHEFNDWALINRYINQVDSLQYRLVGVEHKSKKHTQIINLVNQLGRLTQKDKIESVLNKLKLEQSNDPVALSSINDLAQVFSQMSNSPRQGMLWPKFRWNGRKNQYHYWLVGLLKGDLGKSIVDQKDVGSKIRNALSKTLLLNFLALFVGVFWGFILGVYLAVRRKGWMAKAWLSAIYAIMTVPSFWLASLLVIFFTTSDYGAWTNIFPSEGFGRIPEGASFFTKVSIRLSHLTLPVLSMAIPLAGVLALQLRRSLIAEMKKNYIKTATLKGISRRRVIWVHGVRNSMFPILTMLGSTLPGMIVGSLAIELVFNIPGMGQLLYHSINSKDWSVVFGILMLTSVLTIINLLLMDILYAKLNPKVRLKMNNPNG